MLAGKATSFKLDNRFSNTQRASKGFTDFDIQLGDHLKNNHNLFQVLKNNLPRTKYTHK